MTTIQTPLHPASEAACMVEVDAHDHAGVALRLRAPAVAQQHRDRAAALRARLSRLGGRALA